MRANLTIKTIYNTLKAHKPKEDEPMQSSVNIDGLNNYFATTGPILSAKHDTGEFMTHVPKSITSMTFSPIFVEKIARIIGMLKV